LSIRDSWALISVLEVRLIFRYLTGLDNWKLKVRRCSACYTCAWTWQMVILYLEGLKHYIAQYGCDPKSDLSLRMYGYFDCVSHLCLPLCLCILLLIFLHTSSYNFHTNPSQSLSNNCFVLQDFMFPLKFVFIGHWFVSFQNMSKMHWQNMVFSLGETTKSWL